MNILSIQSAVAFGHVGNSSAVFCLQRLGAEVWPIDTVQFSNHPGHGRHTGSATPPQMVAALVDGIAALGVLPGCDALLTGYIGDPGTGQALLHAAGRVRAANPEALWCCDPVMGDAQPGIYVRPGIDAFFRDQAVPRADILTPNQFELAHLTGIDCGSDAGLHRAARALRAAMRVGGPRIVLVTSVRTEATRAVDIDLLVASGDDSLHRLRTPMLPVAANGAGDAIAAIFLFHILAGAHPAQAMALAAGAIHGVLSATLAAGSRELKLVAAQSCIVNPAAFPPAD